MSMLFCASTDALPISLYVFVLFYQPNLCNNLNFLNATDCTLYEWIGYSKKKTYKYLDLLSFKYYRCYSYRTVVYGNNHHQWRQLGIIIIVIIIII